MVLLSKPRGTQDIYPLRSVFFWKIQQKITQILHQNNYQPIIFPTFEAQELFTSSLGSTTDIIYKEMYTFTDYTCVDIEDKKGRKLALRPEGTASVVRLVCQNNLIQTGYPLKFYYWANMFRYERPQAGRYREFWQLGVELINVSGVQADYQILQLTADILTSLGITNFIFKLNYLGGNDTKKNYIQELTKFITQNNPPLCADCQRRYQTNPLRILDCLTCQEISFPTYKMVWDNQSQNYVQELNHLLDQFNFPYQYDYHLVRGLDYYTGLVFEVSLTNEKALLGGGRYDHLYQKIADRQVPALGFALGIERLLDYLQNYQPLKIDRGVNIFFLTSLNEFYFPILIWKKELTQHSWIVDYNLEVKDLKEFPKIITHYQPRLLVLLGKKEWQSGQITIKDCQKREGFQVEKEKMVEWVTNYLKKSL